MHNFQWKVSSNWNVVELTLKNFVFLVCWDISSFTTTTTNLQNALFKDFLSLSVSKYFVDWYFIHSVILPPTKASLIPFILVNIKKFWIYLYWQYTLLKYFSLHINTINHMLWKNILILIICGLIYLHNISNLVSH